MTKKEDLQQWLIDALEAYQGSATIPRICEHIWHNHEADLRAAGDLFYTWQYDVRWAATELRKSGQLRPASESPVGTWELKRR